MNHLWVFTEEPSIVPVVEHVYERLNEQLGIADLQLKVRPYQGKDALKADLPGKVRSISEMKGSRILVLHDQDNDDCVSLKADLVEAARLMCPHKFVIVCRELEAWFWGDQLAIQKAYSRYKLKTVNEVDKLVKPYLKFSREVPGFVDKGKTANAAAIAPHLSLTSNTSPSFNHFVKTLHQLMCA